MDVQLDLFTGKEVQPKLTKVEQKQLVAKQIQHYEELVQKLNKQNPIKAPEKTRMEVEIVEFEYIGDVVRKRGSLETMKYPKYKLTDKYGQEMFWVSTGKTPIFQTPFNAKVTVYGHTGEGRYVKNLKITG